MTQEKLVKGFDKRFYGQPLQESERNRWPWIIDCPACGRARGYVCDSGWDGEICPERLELWVWLGEPNTGRALEPLEIAMWRAAHD